MGPDNKPANEENGEEDDCEDDYSSDEAAEEGGALVRVGVVGVVVVRVRGLWWWGLVRIGGAGWRWWVLDAVWDKRVAGCGSRRIR